MTQLLRRLSSRFIRKRNLPDCVERFVEDDFGVTSAYRHGYPDQPSCFAFDPVSRLMAIGTKDGFITLYGRPGVEQRFEHGQPYPVTQIIFIPNTKYILSICGSISTVFIWNLADETGQVCPMLMKSCKIPCHTGKEKITHAHLPIHSDWVFLGTSFGNVYTVNVKTCKHSNYVIYWSNAARPVGGGKKGAPASDAPHPGEVVGIVEPPAEPSRLLIAFSKGLLIIWNVTKKETEKVFQNKVGIKWVNWMTEGNKLSKRFTVAHIDGSLSEWEQDKKNRKNTCIKSCTVFGDLGSCDYISKVVKAKRSKDEAPLIIFAGGLPATDYLDRNTVTIIQHRSDSDFTTLDCPSKIIDFAVVESPPYKKTETYATALLILTEEELIAIDLLEPSLPEFRLPYLAPIHISPVSHVKYIPNAPNKILDPLNQHYERANTDKYSTNAWPVTGGQLDIDGEPRMTDLVITGHEDGLINIWTVSTSMMKLVYSLETERILEPPQVRLEDTMGGYEDEIEMRKVGKYNPYLNEPLSICQMELCPFGLILCVANVKGEVYKFMFNTCKRNIDCPIYNVDLSPPSEPNKPEKTKGESGSIAFPPGLQPDLCIKVYPPGPILTMALNPSAGLLAFGNRYGLAVFDIQRHHEIHAICTLDKSDPLNLIPVSNMTRGEKLRRSLSVRRSRASKRGNTGSVRRTKSEKGGRQAPANRSIKSPPTRAGSSVNRPGQFGNQSARKSRLGQSRRGLGLGVTAQDGAKSDGAFADDSNSQNFKKSRVISLVFAETFPPDPIYTTPVKTLWAGQGCGKMQCYKLDVPEGKKRQEHGVTMTSIGKLTIHHMDAILFMGFVDKEGKMLPDDNHIPLGAAITQPHFFIVVSTLHVKVIELPSSITVRKDRLEGGDVFRKAFVMTFKNAAALVCVKTSGDLNIYSLPHLKVMAKNARCLTRGDPRGIQTLTMARNGYAVYLFNSSEIQWITVAEAFLPPDSWGIPVADPVHRKKIKFDRNKLFEKGKGTTPGQCQQEEVGKAEGFTETLIEYPAHPNNNVAIAAPELDHSASPEVQELFSPEGSLCDSDMDKQSEGSRSGRRSSLADALAEVKSAGYNLFKSASKSSIEEAPAQAEGSSNPTVEQLQSDVHPVVNSLDRNNKAVEERGEKLESLENRTGTMVETARAYSENARKLRQQAARL